MKRSLILITFLSFLSFTYVSAQNDSGKINRPIADTLVLKDTVKKIYPTYKIALFAPLYLDSVFTPGGSFRFRQGIPRFMSPALDFVQGAMVALDSMNEGKDTFQLNIYDSKAYIQTISWLISNHKLDSTQLIIGAVKDAEYKQLADYALGKNIPFVSATYPNDGGITANPSLIIVNPTLRSHCEAIYSFILQNHSTDKIILVRKKGRQEDMVAGYFKQFNEQEGKPLLDLRTLSFDSLPKPEILKSKLDSNRKTLIIGGSLEEAFSQKLTLACSSLNSKYNITLIGMPTWEGFASLRKGMGILNYPVYFTAPYYNNKLDSNSRMVINDYTFNYKGKPGDMAYKGYELMRMSTTLLSLYPGEFIKHINDPALKVINEYNFRPVILKKENTIPDYYENKHLYFMRIMNGAVTNAW